MDAPRDDDPDDPRFGTPEWDDRREERRHHPSGRHIREHDEEGPARVSDYVRGGRAGELREMLEQMRIGEGPPAPPKPKLDLSLNIPTIVLLGGMLLGGVQGWNNLNERIAANERGVQDGKDRAQKYVPLIEALRESAQGQNSENKNQNDRINAIVDSLAEERKQRAADGIETRKAQQDIMALIGRYADKLADIDKSVAVMQAPGRRSDAGGPDREAAIASSTRPR